MWGELAGHKKDLKSTISSSQGWASSVHFNCYSIFIWTYNVCLWVYVVNPRRACAARVTVVVVCVCRLVANSLLKGQFVLKTLSHTQRATKVKKFVGFSLKPLRCRDTALARCTATRAVGHFYSAENAHAHI